MDNFPLADSEFLSKLLEAFRKRGRALKYKTKKLEIERVVELNEGRKLERLEIVATPRTRQRLRLIIWEDRNLFVQSSESIAKAGWKFEYQDAGRLAGQVDPRGLVEAFEKTLSAMFEMEPEHLHRFTTIWRPLLAKGPQGL